METSGLHRQISFSHANKYTSLAIMLEAHEQAQQDDYVLANVHARETLVI
jgi:hypothetical protein